MSAGVGEAERRVRRVDLAADLLFDLRCVSIFVVDGLVIGSAAFVDGVWRMTRGEFGLARKSGARRLRGTADFCTGS